MTASFRGLVVLALVALTGCGPAGEGGSLSATEITTGYLNTDHCRTSGPEAVTAWVGLDDGVGALDIGADGDVEVIREADRLLIHSELVDSGPASTEWVAADVSDLTTPVNQFAQQTRLTQVAGRFWIDANDPLTDLQNRVDDGAESPLGTADGTMIEFETDAEGRITEAVIGRSQDEGGATTTITKTDQPAPELPQPTEEEVTDLAEVPAAGLILTSVLWDAGCVEGDADLEARRECMAHVTDGISVREWVVQTDQSSWFGSIECP